MPISTAPQMALLRLAFFSVCPRFACQAGLQGSHRDADSALGLQISGKSCIFLADLRHVLPLSETPTSEGMPLVLKFVDSEAWPSVSVLQL